MNKEAKQLSKEFYERCNACKTSLNEVYRDFENAERCKLIDSLLKVYAPNVKFNVKGKIVPFFAFDRNIFIGKDEHKYLIICKDEPCYMCTNLATNEFEDFAQYVDDEDDDYMKSRYLYIEELPF